jgi:hypothetical protein
MVAAGDAALEHLLPDSAGSLNGKKPKSRSPNPAISEFGLRNWEFQIIAPD